MHARCTIAEPDMLEVPGEYCVSIPAGFAFIARLLGERHRAPQGTVPLSGEQAAAREQVKAKMAAGAYRFEAVACASCDGRDFQVLALWDLHDLWYPVSRCNGCGLVQANPRLRAQDYLDFYRHHYRSLYSAAAVPDEDFVREQISRGRGVRRWVEDLCGSVAGWRVYEVGCGAGGILKAFAEAGCRVCGCDFDAAYLAAARRLEIEVFVGGSEAFCGQPPADLVILSHVFEHFWDVRGDLARLRRILAPHGLLYVEVPGIFALRAWRHGDFTRLTQTAHTMHFTLATLTHALERHGFVLISGDELVRALFAARRSTLADIQDAHLRLLENTCSEDARVSPASFRQAYLRARWENIGHQIGAAETVALYGAGRHTRYLLDCLRGAPGPRVSVILDDESTRNGSNLDGIRVTNDLLGEAQPPAAIVISSDSLETRLASSAHTRYGARWPIFRLYDGLPPGPYPA